MRAGLIARRLPIRAKLTLAYSSAIALMLAGIGVFLYFHFKSGLDQGIDQALRTRADDLGTLVRQQGLSRLSASRSLVERGESFAQILDRTGHVLEASPRHEGKPLLGPDEVHTAARRSFFVDRGEQSRLLARPVRATRPVIVVVGASLDQREHALETMGGALLIGGPLALLLASAGGYAVASSALRPVESMRRRAATISATNADARLPLPDAEDEVHRLGTTLNEMLARLQEALEHERSFVSDASHELHTPLAILKTEVEVALRSDASAPDLRTTLQSVEEEVDRLAQLSEDLLALSRSDDRGLPLRVTTIDVSDVFEAVAGRFRLRAQESGRHIATQAENVQVEADIVRVEQALSNLVDNALRYGEGSVGLRAQSNGGLFELHVTDEGRGFPDEFLPRAFERFSRPDMGRGGGGAGLGLAIVSAIAHAHGGKAGVVSGRSGGGDVWFSVPARRG
jgi:two-component system OmpR family sensor kinase